ncbi:sensor domain-containing diguanylate cyclase [Halodesulfovibrio marinisediminis]|uniref:PAS domain S-box-containing protein/diguanylate cyclase (GGDEF) domain-containing protein n=1 Tax=Halodesulfovibrio marinisediminis DSM 17456 TaxID=1121457 RepID=A0A1N6F8L8_9BACT|nr:sensor domain-containing diguanylate cyclase [Halodesulfovibrio marinisediminis]SIN91600.1 PAS domain S-box-containing protein/diguanylate cyclase (GGDEF) domain-containing protein [Halodesulfovibrio marinisediminis DSM 17456]
MDTDFYKDVLMALSDGVYVVNKKREILFWSDGAEKVTGYSSSEVLGKRCADNVLCHVTAEGEELCTKGCPLRSTIRNGNLAEADVFLHHKLGHRVPVTVKATPLKDQAGKVVGAVEFFSQLSSQDNFLAELEKLRNTALTDRLTKVGNRRFGEITLENLTRKASDTPYGLLFVDIDHFKHVNDTWGHSVGDDVLRMVANSVSSGLRTGDAISRWGGEEFLLILPSSTVQELVTIGERLRMLVEKSWLEYQGTIIKVTASIGGAMVTKGEDVTSVLQRADKQLYFCKSNGRNMVSIDDAILITNKHTGGI